MSKVSSSAAVLQTLAWINKQGFRAVPTHHQSKAAVSKDYVALDYKPPSEDTWKRNNYGVGIVTGPQHSGPVDADLDCPEAVFFAHWFLPKTGAVFGRASKPRSHFLYRVEASSFEKISFLDPVNNTTILELRGDAGHQTVAPGSIHQDTGEPIEWADVPFPEVTVVPSEQLIKTARKVAIATLVSRHVWHPGYHNEAVKHLSGMLFYLEWTEDEIIDLIQAVMEYTDDDDKSRIPTVRATVRRGVAGKKISGAGVLRKQLKDDALIDRLLDLAGSPTVNLLQQYNDRFAVVAIEGRFRIADTDVSPGESPVFYMKDDFLNIMGTDMSDVCNDAGKPIPKARLWLAHPRRRAYRGVDFVPGTEDLDILNLWNGWGVEPSTEGSCKAWLKLLHDVICDGNKALTNWMLHWFANIVREPTRKSLTAPVIIGPEGAGKSLMLGYFGRILGRRGYTTITNEDHIYGRFNKHLATTLLLHSEEALYGGEKKHAGIIRSLITDEFRIYEQKGIDAQQVRNYLRLVLTSNELHAAPAKPGDRRYTVISMGDRKASERLITDVLEEMEQGGPAVLFQFLLDMDYDPKVARTNVKNEALRGLKETNMTPIEKWWHETLMRGTILPDYLAWATVPEREEWPETVSSTALHASMAVHIQAHGQRTIPNGTLLALHLNKFLGGFKLNRSQRNYDDPLTDNIPVQARNLGARHYSIVNMPNLETCRNMFDKYLGQKVEWPEDDGLQETKEDNF